MVAAASCMVGIAGATPNHSSGTQQFKPKITRIKRLISASLNRIILKLRTQAMRRLNLLSTRYRSMAVIKRLIDLKQVWIRLAAMPELLQAAFVLCQRRQHRRRINSDDEEKWSCSSSNRIAAGNSFERFRTPFWI